MRLLRNSGVVVALWETLLFWRRMSFNIFVFPSLIPNRDASLVSPLCAAFGAVGIAALGAAFGALVIAALGVAAGDATTVPRLLKPLRRTLYLPCAVCHVVQTIRSSNSQRVLVIIYYNS